MFSHPQNDHSVAPRRNASLATPHVKMHVHFEETLTHSDCVIQALSWMGKVPDILPEEDGWKLNRNNYYQVCRNFFEGYGCYQLYSYS